LRDPGLVLPAAEAQGSRRARDGGRSGLRPWPREVPGVQARWHGLGVGVSAIAWAGALGCSSRNDSRIFHD